MATSTDANRPRPDSRVPPSDAVTMERRTQVNRVRSTVRTQLAQSQRRRQQLTDALHTLRQDLIKYRSQVRTRLREIGHEVAGMKPVSRSSPPDKPQDPGSR